MAHKIHLRLPWGEIASSRCILLCVRDLKYDFVVCCTCVCVNSCKCGCVFPFVHRWCYQQPHSHAHIAHTHKTVLTHTYTHTHTHTHSLSLNLPFPPSPLSLPSSPPLPSPPLLPPSLPPSFPPSPDPCVHYVHLQRGSYPAEALPIGDVLVDLPFDIMGVKLLWWTWHDNIEERSCPSPGEVCHS